MKLNLDFADLQNLVRSMGASTTNWKIGSVQLSPRAKAYQELEKGKEIALEELEAGPGKLLTYNGEQVLLYIKDTRSSKDTLLYAPEDSRRFHIAECRTLNEMRAKGRFERYVVTTRSDGFFLVDYLERETNESGEIEAGLKVCKYCLGEINYELYNFKKVEQNEIWNEFLISSFLKEYSTFFTKLPGRMDTNAPVDRYVKDWAKISRDFRSSRDWICENCHVDLSSNRRLLHTHHISGVKTDNSEKNLKALCAVCHSEEPAHSHLKVTESERRTIKSARLLQNQL